MTDEIDLERAGESAGKGQQCLANLLAILETYGSDNVGELARAVYKDNDWGPILSVRLHDGLWVHGTGLWLVQGKDVAALLITSIVEGSDAEVRADPVELVNYDEAAAAVAEFTGAVEWVGREVCTHWHEANGGGFTDEDHAAIEAMRERGFAVVVFTPAELAGADPGPMQDRLVELGNEYLALVERVRGGAGRV